MSQGKADDALEVGAAPPIRQPAPTVITTSPSDAGSSYFSPLRDLIRTSGIYALASFASPLVALILAPFLTRRLSSTDYGAFAVLVTVIALAAGVTQLSLGSAFFRTYNYDYEAKRDRLDVLATLVTLLLLTSISTTCVVLLMAPWVANVLLGDPAFAGPVRLAAVVMLLQNLSVPGLAWLRADSRPLAYSALSIVNLLTTLVATIVLVGVMRDGLPGGVLAMALGYGAIVLATLPRVLKHAGIRLRRDMARNLLSFGVPLVATVVGSWVLQLSDRYLLGHFGSLAQTASYDVAYKLGGVLAVAVLSPFNLAWPIVLFTVAKRSDAPQLFRLIFRWYSLVLLVATYALSLVGIHVLPVLFPPAYYSATLLIPIVAVSIMLFGVYVVLTLGVSIRRKTWLAALLFALAAGCNVGLNLVLIPRYGAAGAAVSTLGGYIVLAVSGYLVSQRIYPVPFEVGRFVMAVLVGTAIFALGALVVRDGPWSWFISIAGLFIYAGWLLVLTGGRNMLRLRQQVALVRQFVGQRSRFAQRSTRSSTVPDVGTERAVQPPVRRVCMHVLGTARNDMRVVRAATALMQAGSEVTIIDVEGEHHLPRRENLSGIATRHIVMPNWFKPTRFKPWFLVKAGWILTRGTVALLLTPADIYYAHDFTALPACFLASRLHRKPLIFDAHELPLVDPNVIRWPRLCAVASTVLGVMIRNCAGLITVSPLIAHELAHRYESRPVVVVRNIPAYQSLVRSNRLRLHLGLDRNTRVALYQGNLQADRGLTALIRAARFVDPGIVILMMGRGEMQRELEALIRQEGVADRVKVIAPVPYQDLLVWTASADLGLILNPPAYSPNVRMCLPNKLFEYLMAGLPVLSAPLDAVADVLQTYEVGWILPSLEPEVIGHTINRMLADWAALAGMHSRSMNATRDELCWEHESQRLIQLYRQIVKGDGSGVDGPERHPPRRKAHI